MPRDLPLGNGDVLVNFDRLYRLQDLYFPYVGMENHSPDRASRFGFRADGQTAWVGDEAVAEQPAYHKDTLVTHVPCRLPLNGLDAVLEDAVDCSRNIFLRKATLTNRTDRPREVQLFFHLNVSLYGSEVGDTVYYHPDLKSLVFYKGRRYISLSCAAEGKPAAVDGFAAGKKGPGDEDGTWLDATDGQLSGNPITQGAVDGTVELKLTVPAGGTAVGWFWLTFGRSVVDVVQLEDDVRKAGPARCLQETLTHWQQWLEKDRHDLSVLPEEEADLYHRSLLIIRTHTDNRGAILAANDSDIRKFAKDTYSYMWPRDGALISHALDRSGYHDVTRRFFDFCRTSLSSEGFMMHKYNPDGSAGSSWHPWVNELGEKQYPIQEDETALVLFSLWHHYRQSDTLADSNEDYEKLVVPASRFLTHYRSASGLPLPSYDLWEERYGVFAFTVSAVYAGLTAAARFAEYHGDAHRAEWLKEAAGQVRKAAESELYSPEAGRFIRALYWNHELQTYEPDMTLDASMYGLYDFEMFAEDDPRLVRTMDAVFARLTVRTEVDGMARYEDDYYHQVSREIERVPGNPWFICTLWHAEWMIRRASTPEELNKALDRLRWANRHALPSGVMAEQADPHTGEPLSVSPLVWSHATYVKTVQEWVSKYKQLTGQHQRLEDLSDRSILKPARSGR